VTTPAPDKPKAGLSWRTKLALGCVLSPLALLLACGLVGGISYWMFLRRSHDQMWKEITLIRQTDAPLNSTELFYQYNYDPAVDERDEAEDITEELTAQLAFSSEPGFQKSVNHLPIVGIERDAPAPGTDWPKIAEAEAFLAERQAWLDFCETLPGRRFKAQYAEDVRFAMATKLTLASQLRTGIRVLSLQAHVDLYQQKTAAAIKRIEQMLVLARSMGNEPSIISQLVRNAFIEQALRNLGVALSHGEVADEDIVRLQSLLRDFDFRASLQLALKGERAWYFTEMSLPLEWFCAKGGAPEDVIFESTSRTPAREADAALMLSNFRRLLAANDESLRAAIQESKVLEQEYKKLSSSPTRLLYVQNLLLFPGLHVTPRAFARLDARCRCMDALLAAIRYHRANGRWSTTLEELVPEFLPTVPIDAYDEKPLRLLVTDQELKIYSVGENELDDGGTWTNRVQTDVGFALPIK
jgi:hypothetical protein